MAKKVSRLLDIVRKMPPLHHTLPGEEFDIFKSEMVQWLIKQPEVLSYISNRVRDGKHIIYNSNTGTWQGVDYDGS